MVQTLSALVAPLPEYDRVSVGFPGLVRRGRILTAHNLGAHPGVFGPSCNTMALSKKEDCYALCEITAMNPDERVDLKTLSTDELLRLMKKVGAEVEKLQSEMERRLKEADQKQSAERNGKPSPRR